MPQILITTHSKSIYITFELISYCNWTSESCPDFRVPVRLSSGESVLTKYWKWYLSGRKTKRRTLSLASLN
jgi:hypothetical protein